ncbi:GDP-mannose 4,6-dehydratase [Sulfurimonas sp.]|uniref:GDP-mannose 4,6-dehydratase n=1 Tax=Sulfurimonas sp. TaxID=2022749 RepID=UPI002AB00E6D|nr:GDP-mannose 4,6-dehydratase [Sulfurimonas sp.]
MITGIYGQDGSYMAEILKDKDYVVYGIVKKTLSSNSESIKAYLTSIGVVPIVFNVDLCNYNDLKNLLLELCPDEIYHLSAYHYSSESSLNNDYHEKLLFEHNVASTLNILSICSEYLKNTRIVTAGSCLMFDSSKTIKQNEKTPFSSSSLYGLAKITEANLVKYYRDKGLHASTAILYNHESSRRKDNFVTKKIIKNLVAVQNGEIEKFSLGNINITKDWGYARDYTYGMFLMCQSSSPKDYILASGTSRSIRNFIEIAAKILEIKNWEKHIEIDRKFLTRKFSTELKGDSSLASSELKWKSMLKLEKLIELMIKNELNENLE